MSDRLECLDVDSPSAAMHDAYKDKRSDLDELVRIVRPLGGQVGAVAEVSGRPVALDLVSRPDAFAELLPRLAQGYALVGMSEQALHWLTIAVDRGFINYPFLARHDPFFEALRRQPRFQQLMETVRERWERFEA